MRLSTLLIPTVSNQLRALCGWLDKAEAFVATRGDSADGLLALRLAPDMFPLTTQLRFVAFQSLEPMYRLRHQVVPAHVLEIRQEGRDGGERPGNWAEARARLNEAADFIAKSTPTRSTPRRTHPLRTNCPRE